MKNTALKSAANISRPTMFPAANPRERSSPIGSIGSDARSSQSIRCVPRRASRAADPDTSECPTGVRPLHRGRSVPICHSFGVLVLTLEGDRISKLTRFGDTGILPQFGLPRTLPD